MVKIDWGSIGAACAMGVIRVLIVLTVSDIVVDCIEAAQNGHW